MSDGGGREREREWREWRERERERQNVDVIPINRMDGVGLADRTVSEGGGGVRRASW